MKLKLKQNIGMSLHIAVVDKPQKWYDIKLMNRKIEIENEVSENENLEKMKQNTGIIKVT